MLGYTGTVKERGIAQSAAKPPTRKRRRVGSTTIERHHCVAPRIVNQLPITSPIKWV